MTSQFNHTMTREEFEKNDFRKYWSWILNAKILSQYNNGKEIFGLQKGTVFPKDKKLLFDLSLLSSPQSGTCYGNKHHGVFILYSSKQNISTTKHKRLKVFVQKRNTRNKKQTKPRPAVLKSFKSEYPLFLLVEKKNKTYTVSGQFLIHNWDCNSDQEPFVLLKETPASNLQQ